MHPSRALPRLAPVDMLPSLAIAVPLAADAGSSSFVLHRAITCTPRRGHDGDLGDTRCDK